MQTAREQNFFISYEVSVLFFSSIIIAIDFGKRYARSNLIRKLGEK